MIITKINQCLTRNLKSMWALPLVHRQVLGQRASPIANPEKKIKVAAGPRFLSSLNSQNRVSVILHLERNRMDHEKLNNFHYSKMAPLHTTEGTGLLVMTHKKAKNHQPLCQPAKKSQIYLQGRLHDRQTLKNCRAHQKLHKPLTSPA